MHPARGQGRFERHRSFGSIAADGGARELFVCGGGGAYAAAMPLADRLILTHVASHLGKGVPFPPSHPGSGKGSPLRTFPPIADHPHALTFASYERRSPAKQLTDRSHYNKFKMSKIAFECI
jgi:hypothetical protein